MSTEELQKSPPKLCPFLKKPCLEEGCTLWVLIQMGQITPLGMAAMKTMHLCVFNAILMVTGTPKPASPGIPRLPGLAG